MISTHSRRLLVALLLALLPAAAAAQPQPITATTIKATSPTATALCVGCPVATTIPAANSGARLATITIDPLVAPSITTNKLYSVSGALTWNGTTLATGSTIAGTVNTIGLFTGVAAMGNSLLTQSGSTVTMAGTLAATTHTGAHSGNGAALTAIPTSAVSTGNFVATVASGTGITSSVTSGNAAATTISLNNTAVTPGAYPTVTVDQQGRVTLGSTLLTATGFGTHSLSAGGSSANVLQVVNTSAGAAAEAALYVGNDQAAARLRLEMLSSTFTPTGRYFADGALIDSTGAGGLSLSATHASGVIRLFTGGGVLRATLDAAGSFQLTGATYPTIKITSTSASTGGLLQLDTSGTSVQLYNQSGALTYDPGSGVKWVISTTGAHSIGGANVTDAVSTPTVGAGLGAGASVAGKALAFKVTLGTTPVDGIVNLNTTFANPVICVGGGAPSAGGTPPQATGTSTSAVSIKMGSTPTAGDSVYVLCRGY